MHQGVDEQAAHVHAVRVLPRPSHPRQMPHVRRGALVALLGRADLIARLGGLPALRDRVRVVEAAVGVLEGRLDLELERVAGELHPHDALVDADFGVDVPRRQVVPDSVEDPPRPRLVVVVRAQLGREDEDHVEVGHASDGRVSAVGAHHQPVVGAAVLGPEVLVQRLRDLVSARGDRGAVISDLQVLEQAVENV